MLNVQTDHLDNHTARLTVEVDAERMDKAMRSAARRLSHRATIPGFRPGKAPYHIVLNMFGRAYVLDQALEMVGNDIYREALEASGVEPYAPGSLEDVSEDGQKLVFVVPKQPTVALGDYRAIRVEAEDVEVTDEMVNEAMEGLREDQAVIEPAERPAQLGDLVMMEHLELSVPFEAEDEGDEDDEGDESDDDAENEEEDSDDEEDEEDDDLDDDEDTNELVLLHRHDFEVVLYGDERDMVPGLAAAIAGMSAGDEAEFALEVPADHEDETIAGKTVRVEAHVAQVKSRTLPEWNDELAKKVSDGEFETILELRQDMRKRLAEQAERQARQVVAEQALEKMIEEATINYPEEVIQDTITDLLADLENSVLRGQGLTLKDFLQITGQTEEELREQYHGRAERRTRSALVFYEFLRQEKVAVSDPDIDAEIERMSASFGEKQAPVFKQYLSSAQNRSNIENDLVTNRGVDLLVAIARGEDILAPSPAADEQPAAVEETADETDAAAPLDAPEGDEASETAEEG